MDAPAIEAVDLRKAYGQVRALDGMSFQVPSGTVLGLLGPNGSGKTTAVSILSTAQRPDAGRATVCSLDTVRDAAAVREVIGLAGQFAAVDANLTGRENLTLIGRLRRGRAPTWPGFPPIIVAPALLALTVIAAPHGLPPFLLIPLAFVVTRRHRRWNREARPCI